MSTENNNQAEAVDSTNNGGEGEPQSESITLSKAEYEKMNQDLGSLKRELKEFKKPKDSDKTPEKTNNSDFSKDDVEDLLMQVSGITKDSETALAKKLQKETNLPLKQLLNSKYFKTELEDLRTSEANAEASTGIKGDKQNSQGAKGTAEYWVAKGEYPTREQVSDPKVRTEIRKALVAKEKGKTGGFYNS